MKQKCDMFLFLKKKTFNCRLKYRYTKIQQPVPEAIKAKSSVTPNTFDPLFLI